MPIRTAPVFVSTSLRSIYPPHLPSASLVRNRPRGLNWRVRLEIAKMEAEVQNLQSLSQLNMAKAQESAADPQLKVAEIQSKMQMKQQELALRQELSSKTNRMRQGQSETQAATKLAAEAMKNSGGN